MRILKMMFLVTALLGCGMRARAAAEMELADGLVAVVADVPITQLGVERYTGDTEGDIIRQLGNQPDEARRQIVRMRELGLQTLITRQIILHDFKENIKVPESIIEEIVQDKIKEQFHGDNIELTKYLELKGITREQYKQEIRDQFIVSSMRSKFVPEPIISPRKIEDYYLAHRDEFKLEDQIKMRMIVLTKTTGDSVEPVQKRAEEILSQIKSGASFEDLARTYSEGSQRAEGGETGWEDLSVVKKELAAALVKLNPGQYSGVIETTDGFYILLLEDRHPAHFKPLNEMRDQIERVLSGQEMDRLAKQWVERLRKKTFVQHF